MTAPYHFVPTPYLICLANFKERQKKKNETFILRSLLPCNSFLLCYLTKRCYSYDLMSDIEILKSKRGNPIAYHDGLLFMQDCTTIENVGVGVVVYAV
jgi:hypothetical protein